MRLGGGAESYLIHSSSPSGGIQLGGAGTASSGLGYVAVRALKQSAGTPESHYHQLGCYQQPVTVAIDGVSALVLIYAAFKL